MPAPIEELRPHARRILNSIQYTYSSIPHAEFLSLLRLILSVQLDTPQWGDHEPYLYTGRVLIPPDPDIIQGTANAILRKSTPSEKGDVDWSSFQNIVNIDLPDFIPQLRLIFTSFLYPFTAPDQTLNVSTPKSHIPIPYVQYLNLFLHPPLANPKLHVFEEFVRQEAHYALQTIQPVYSASPPTLSIVDLVTALRPIKTGTLLLITGEAIIGTAHSGPAHLKNVTMSEEDDANNNQGNPSEKNPSKNPKDSPYHSVDSSAANAAESATNNWETNLRIQKFELYDLGGHATAPFEEHLAEKPRLRAASPVPYRTHAYKKGASAPAIRKPSVPQVGREDLKKRIQGFGPSV